MKNLIIILSFLLSSSSILSQEIRFDDVFNFYEGEKVYKMEPELLDSLFVTYEIDTTGYVLNRYYDDFDLNVELYENYQHDVVVYYLNKITSEVKCDFYVLNEDKVKLNQYMLIFISDSDKSRIINIVQF